MLTKRLKSLVEAGLLERRRYNDRPPRYEYLLTERGIDFRPVVVALYAWGNKHFAPEGASVVLMDTETGKRAEPVLVDRPTGQPIELDRHVFVAGPAASQRTKQRMESKARARAARDSSREPSRRT